MQKVRKAVIPVAGLGTRFLPATKSMPKEMLPVVDKPVVQYAVDEAFEAGIEHIVFVTGRNKAVIEDYFDLHPELIGTLEQTGKKAQLQSLESLLPVAGATSFIRQQSPHGLGHAVWCARDVIGNEPFALLLPDMVSFGAPGCLAETVDLYQRTGGNVIAVERCDPSETSKYGIVGRGAEVASG
ncbi:MAG: UTP--glucose-1-phosphate uridylyltransferase, partial [Mesorhizobium sp.]